MRKIFIMAILYTAVVLNPNNSVYATIYQTRNGEAGFSVSAPAKTIVGQTKQVHIQIDNSTAKLKLTVPVKSFQFTSNFLSDSLNNIIYERFNTHYMESSRYAAVSYDAAILNMASVHFEKDGAYPIRTKGTLRIHGIDQEVIAEGTLYILGETITLKAKIVILPLQYKIRIPSYISNLYFREVFIESKANLKKK